MAFYKEKDGSILFPLYWPPRLNVVLGVDPSYLSDSDLAEEAAKMKDEQQVVIGGEKKLSEDVDRPGQSKVLGYGDQSLEQYVGSSKKRKRSKDVGSSEVHNISDDEQKSENIVDVFLEFLGSTQDLRSLWESNRC
ncbi:hypothetical protein SESBI_32581 [Sesbania bispinosa]|nr:hypothetical protein SESBI_32581 [Sesbania bispinosa]